MATLEKLGADHVSWLLVVANNYLRQNRADRAIVLLELLGLVDPQDIQGRKMLAYAYLLENDRTRCRAALERISGQPLTERDLVALQLMSVRLGEGGLETLPRTAETAGTRDAAPE